VHRDLKLDNILVRPDGLPVIVDFGLSSQFAGRPSREKLEVRGAREGTLAYTAPEQLAGGLVDARADLYSLGCILHELLTGRLPSAGLPKDEFGPEPLEAAPIPPSQQVQGIPPELDALVLRLLAWRPQERIGHADLVAAALEKLGAADGLARAGPRPRAYLYRPSLAGREDQVRALDRLLVRLQAGTGGAVLIGGESGVGKTRLLIELAQQARGQKIDVLSGECLPDSGTPLQALRGPLRQLADRCREQGLPEAELEGEALGCLGNLFRLTGQGDEAHAILEQALSLHRQAGNRQGEGLALGHLAGLHHGQGRMEEARQFYEQALSIHRQAGDRRGEGSMLGHLAVLDQEQGRLDEARQKYERALSIHRQLGNRLHEGTVLGNLANLYADRGRSEEARPLYEQALDLLRQAGDRRGEGWVLGGLANLHRDEGRTEEARPLFEQALDLLRQAGDRRGEGWVLGGLANLHHDEGRMEEARLLFERALTVHRQVGDRRLEGWVLGNLAVLHHEQGRMDEPGRLFEQALDLLRQVGSRNEEAFALYSQAALERRAFGQLDRARQLALQADSLLRQTGDRLSLAVCLCEQGHGSLAQGQSGRGLLEQAEQTAKELALRPESELGKALSRLRRAQAAFEAGRPLFRGELWEDLPEGLRRWLAEAGRLEDREAPLPSSVRNKSFPSS
jgi:tetratricopeptide (TPR) repeat protein